MEATEEDVKLIRTLIPDTEAVFGQNEDETMFTDDEIKAYFVVGGGSWLRAAAHANLAIATSEALISKRIRTQDLTTDGPAVARALTERAKVLFEQADAEDKREGDEFFQIVDYGQGWTVERPELTEYGFLYR